MKKYHYFFDGYSFDQEKRFKQIRKEIEENQSLKEFFFSAELFDHFFMYVFYFAFMFALIVPENYPLF